MQTNTFECSSHRFIHLSFLAVSFSLFLFFSFVHLFIFLLFRLASCIFPPLLKPFFYSHDPTLLRSDHIRARALQIKFRAYNKQNVVQMHYKWNEGVRHHRWATAIKYAPYVPDTRKREKNNWNRDKVHYDFQVKMCFSFIYFCSVFIYFISFCFTFIFLFIRSLVSTRINFLMPAV